MVSGVNSPKYLINSMVEHGYPRINSIFIRKWIFRGWENFLGVFNRPTVSSQAGLNRRGRYYLLRYQHELLSLFPNGANFTNAQLFFSKLGVGMRNITAGHTFNTHSTPDNRAIKAPLYAGRTYPRGYINIPTWRIDTTRHQHNSFLPPNGHYRTRRVHTYIALPLICRSLCCTPSAILLFPPPCTRTIFRFSTHEIWPPHDTYRGSVSFAPCRSGGTKRPRTEAGALAHNTYRCLGSAPAALLTS